MNCNTCGGNAEEDANGAICCGCQRFVHACKCQEIEINALIEAPLIEERNITNSGS